jgi:triacylglycerol lipase
MEYQPLIASASALENSYTLACVTHSTLRDDPFETYPDLRTIFPELSTFEVEAHWGMVMWNADTAVLAFRGTDSNLEWAQSFSYKQTLWMSGKAHGGFVRALDMIWEPMLAALYDTGVLEGTKTLWVSGHSLGGALALLAGSRLDQMGFEIHEVVTFGTPQVFDLVAADAYPVPVHRFVNNEDPVPRMTWPTLFDKYTHVGEEYFLLASGALGEQRHSHGLSRRIDRANSIGEGILPAGWLHDHFMREYVRKLGLLWAVGTSASQ